MGDAYNPFYMAAFSQLSRRLAESGLHMLVFTAEKDEPGDVPVQDLLKYQVDALVLMSTQLSSDLATQCQKGGIPVVFFNRRARYTKGMASITGTNAEGGRVIASHLVGRGYRRLAYMAGSPDSSTSKEREAAFMKYCADRGVPRPARVVGHYDRQRAKEAMRLLLSSPQRPDAIFCANDVMAIACAEVARHEFMLRVGPDVGIAGYDDTDQAGWPSFDLTSYSQPIPAMVEEVVKTLVNRRPNHVRIQGSLLIRSSTDRRPIL